MTALALRRRLEPRANEKPDWLVLALAALWTAAVVVVLVGFDGLPGAVLALTAVLLLTFPVVVFGAALRPRSARRPHVRMAASWTALVIFALGATLVVAIAPILAFAVPTLMLAAIACRRYPAAATTGVLFLTGSYGTLAAYTPIASKPLIDLILAGLWAGTIWAYLFGGRERPMWIWPGVAACAVYIALTTGALLGAETLSVGISDFHVTAWYMMAFLLVGYAQWGEETHRRIARGFVGVAALVGGYATYRWVVGPGADEAAGALANNGIYEVVNGELRTFGSFTSGKELGAWTAALVPFSVAYALTSKSRWTMVAIVAAVLCTIGLLASEARAAFVGAVIGVAVVLVLYQLARGFPGLHLGVTAMAVIVIVGIGVFAFTQTAGDSEAGVKRYTSLVTAPTQDPSYEARIFKWRNALEDIRDHPLGQGLGAANGSGRFYSIGSVSIDSSYLKIALEQGFAVMVFFILSILLLLYGLARRAIFAASRQSAGLAIAAVGALVALAVLMFSGTFISGYPALTTWLIVGLGVAQFSSPRP